MSYISVDVTIKDNHDGTFEGSAKVTENGTDNGHVITGIKIEKNGKQHSFDWSEHTCDGNYWGGMDYDIPNKEIIEKQLKKALKQRYLING
jgi:hypothetical protein